MSGDDKLGVLEAEDDGDAPGIEIDDVRRAELEEAICPAGRKATADFERGDKMIHLPLFGICHLV